MEICSVMCRCRWRLISSLGWTLLIFHVQLEVADSFHWTTAIKFARNRHLTTSFLPRISTSYLPVADATIEYTEDNKNTAGSFSVDTESAKVDDKETTVDPKRTFYDILGVTPDATREVIKQRFLILAKEYHPDSNIGKTSSDNLKLYEQRFAEAASAWKVLGNKRERLRYDRSLQAAAFANDVTTFVKSMGQQAGPPARRIFEELAVPFLRRSAATTVASFTAASNNLKNGTAVNLGNAVVSAIQAGQIASTVVDSIELTEQADVLEQRAVQELEKAAKAKAAIKVVNERRLLLVMRTPNAELTSTDALQILEGLNSTVETFSLMERTMWKQPLEHGIRELEEVETDFQIKLQVQQQTETLYRELSMNYQREEIHVRLAVEAEERARKAWEAAQRLVTESKVKLLNTTKALSTAEVAAKRSAGELDRVSLTLSRRQERVRRMLRKKEEVLREKEEQGLGGMNGDVAIASPFALACDGDDQDLCLADLEECQKEERRLTRESARLQDAANRMSMRAARLRDKAAMKRQQFAKDGIN